MKVSGQWIVANVQDYLLPWFDIKSKMHYPYLNNFNYFS